MAAFDISSDTDRYPCYVGVHESADQFQPGFRIRHYLQERFRSYWDKERRSDRKLISFYNSCKPEFDTEKCVLLTYQSHERRVAAIRMSSHKLHVETGRYKNIPRQERICRCTTADKDIIAGFLHLPECELPIENEYHCLFDCSFYSDIRTIYYVADGIHSEVASCPQKVYANAVSIKLFDKLATAVLKKHRTLL